MAVAQRLIKKFKSCKLTQIPRELNSQAHALANLGSALKTNSQMNIPLLGLQWPATLEELPLEEVSVVEEGKTSMTVGVKNGHDGIKTRKSLEIVFPKKIVKRKI